MAMKCLISNCGRPGQPTMIDNLAEHLTKDHGIKLVKMKSQECVIALTYSKLKNNTEETNTVENPIMVEYDGIHFLLTIYSVDGRRYFWMYLCEDEILSDGRRFYGSFTLLSPINVFFTKRSKGNVIHPPSSSVTKIMEKKILLFSINERGLKKLFVANDVAHISFRVIELTKKIQSKSSLELEKTDEISTAIQNLQIKPKISPESEVSKDKCFSVTCSGCGFVVGKLIVNGKLQEIVMKENNSPSFRSQEMEQNPIGVTSSLMQDNNSGNGHPTHATLEREVAANTYELTQDDIICIKEMEKIGISPNLYAKFLSAFIQGDIEYQTKVEEAVRKYLYQEK